MSPAARAAGAATVALAAVGVITAVSPSAGVAAAVAASVAGAVATGVLSGRAPSRPPEPALDGAFDELLYLVSHELHEPARTIRTFSEILLEDHSDALDAEGRIQVAFVRDAGARMHARIEVLLALSRAGRGPRGMCDLTEGIDASREAVAGESGLRVEVAGALPQVWADPVALRAVFDALLRNSVDFAGEAPPRVRIAATRDRDGVTVEVCDRGVGLDPRYHEKMFLPYWSRDAAGRPRTGAGLALCERVLRRHGGWIRVKTAPPLPDGSAGPGLCLLLHFPHAQGPT